MNSVAPILLVGFPSGHGHVEGVHLSHRDGTAPLPEGTDLALYLDDLPTDRTATNQRRLDIGRALRAGHSVYLVAGPNVSNVQQRELWPWIQSRFLPALSFPPSTELRVCVDALRPYFEQHLAHAAVHAQDQEVLAQTRETQSGVEGDAASIRLRVGAGYVLFVPVRNADVAAEALLEFRHLLPPPQEYPPYLDELVIGPEEGASEEINRLQQRISDLRAAITSSQELKKVLYSGNTTWSLR